MPVFRDTEHLYQVLGALFERVSAEPAIADRLLEGKLVVRFRFTDPEGAVTIDLRQAPITYTFGESDLEPDVEMIQSGDTTHQFWLGRLNVARAIATRKVISRGSVPKALALLPAVKPAFEIYPQVLHELGYEEMIPEERRKGRDKGKEGRLIRLLGRLRAPGGVAPVDINYGTLNRHFIPLVEDIPDDLWRVELRPHRDRSPLPACATPASNPRDHVFQPGLIIIAPGTPYDAKGLLKAAIRSNNPVLFFENKLLYTAIGPVPEEEYIVPIGVAEVKRAGDDVTLVAIGAMVGLALEAAETLGGEGISVEVVDPRTLVPCDWATVVRPVVRTGRLVVTEPGPLTHGFGAEVVARVAGVGLGALKAPPRRVAGADVPIPYNRALENAALPDVEDVLKALRAVLASPTN
ncbi:MAG: transketolase C-terminal domain-containing protein [Anaerolineae bacterium]